MRRRNNRNNGINPANVRRRLARVLDTTVDAQGVRGAEGQEDGGQGNENQEREDQDAGNQENGEQNNEVLEDGAQENEGQGNENQEGEEQEAGNHENEEQEAAGQMGGNRRQVQFDDAQNVVAEYTIAEGARVRPYPYGRRRRQANAVAVEVGPAGGVPDGERQQGQQQEEQAVDIPGDEPAEEEDAGEELAQQFPPADRQVEATIEDDLAAGQAEERAAGRAEEERRAPNRFLIDVNFAEAQERLDDEMQRELERVEWDEEGRPHYTEDPPPQGPANEPPAADQKVEEVVGNDLAAHQREGEAANAAREEAARGVDGYMRREEQRGRREEEYRRREEEDRRRQELHVPPTAATTRAFETQAAENAPAIPAARTFNPRTREANAPTNRNARGRGLDASTHNPRVQTAAEGLPAGAQAGPRAVGFALGNRRRATRAPRNFRPLALGEAVHSRSNLRLGLVFEDPTTYRLRDHEAQPLVNGVGGIFLGDVSADLSSPMVNMFRDPSDRPEDALLLNVDHQQRPEDEHMRDADPANPPTEEPGSAAGVRGLLGLPTGPPRFDNLGSGHQRCSTPGTSVLSGAVQKHKNRPMFGGAGQDVQPGPQTVNLPGCGGASQAAPATHSGGQRKRPAKVGNRPGELFTPPSSPEGKTAGDSGRVKTPSTTVSYGLPSAAGTEAKHGEKKNGSSTTRDTEKSADLGTPVKRKRKETEAKKEEKKEKGKEKKDKDERTTEEPHAVLTRSAAGPLRRSISWKTSLRESTTELSRNCDSSSGILKSQSHRLKRPTTRAINISHVSSGSRASETPSLPDPPHLASPFQRVFEDYFDRGGSRNSSAPFSVASVSDDPSNPFSSRRSTPLRPAFPVLAESPEPVSNPSDTRDQVPSWTDDSRRRPSTVTDPQPLDGYVPESTGQRLWKLPGRVARRIGNYVGGRGLGLVASAAACVAAGLLTRAAMSRGDGVYEYVLVSKPSIWYAGG